MKKFDRNYFNALAKWKIRAKPPVPKGAVWDAYEGVLSELGDIVYSDGYGTKRFDKKLSDHQRQALRLVECFRSIQNDGLVIGVLVNDPHLFLAIEGVAESAKSKPLAHMAKHVRGLLPARYFSMKSNDAQFAWFEKNEAKANKIERYTDTKAGEAMQQEMIRLAVIIALDHPDEFFKAA